MWGRGPLLVCRSALVTSSTATTAVSSTRGPTARRPRAWKQAKKPRPPHLRARWKAAQAALKVANSEPRKNSGPGTQKRYLDTLSAALGDAVREKLISENWTDGVVIPKYRPPRPARLDRRTRGPLARDRTEARPRHGLGTGTDG